MNGPRDNAPRPRRIAHIVLQLATGGMERLLVEFARHADTRHFDLMFISMGPRTPLAEDIEASGWKVITLDEPPGLRPGLVLRLARLFAREHVDLVHTHNTKPVLYSAPAARLARVRGLIHTRHGQRFQATRRSTSLFRVVSRLADRVVCVSRDSARLSAQEGVPPGRITTIWNGIDASRFSYLGPSAGGPVVMVGRLSPEKGTDTLIHAAALAAARAPSFRLEIAGGGDCLPALRDLAQKLGVDGHVHFLGEVRDIPALLARASLFVLPSLTEGISLTLLEAMARGLPIVTTRVGGNPEVVVEGETGLLVPARSPEELATAMLQLQADPERGRRMGLAGRARVENHFDVRRMVREYEDLYRTVLGMPGRHPSDCAAPASAGCRSAVAAPGPPSDK